MPANPGESTGPRRPGRQRGSRRRTDGRSQRRSGGRTTLTVAGVAVASALAIGTGVALDRLVLTELRSERVSAGQPAPDEAAPAPGTDQGTRQDALSPSPSPASSESAPPLKPLPDRAARETARPKKSESTAEDDGPSGGTASGGGGPETAVALLTNKERAKEGCAPLRIDAKLVTAAERHSADMAKNNYFDHTSRNGDSPWKRMEAAGYSQPGAENIAMGQPTPAAVMEGWMNSPGHRANILNCKLRAIGVGMATGPGGPWWTQNFGWV